MIVPTMSYPEIYHVLENAAPKIRYKTEQLRPKAVKYFTREVWKYPAWKTYEYTIPATNDTYVIFFYAAEAGAAEKPLAGSFCYLRHWNPWQVMVDPEMAPELLLPPLKLKLLFTYTSHFFDRYRERYLKKPGLSMLDTFCHFFSNNGLMFNLCEADNRLWTAMKDEDTNERIDGRCSLQILDGLELARAWEAQKPDAAEDAAKRQVNVGKDVGKELTDRQLIIINLIDKTPQMSAQQMSEMISSMPDKGIVAARTIERDLAQLKDFGVLTRIGGRKDGFWKINKELLPSIFAQ